jgi:hypothetical protein
VCRGSESGHRDPIASEEFEAASDEQRRQLYEHVLFAAYAATFRLMVNDSEVLEDLRRQSRSETE